MAFGNPFEIRLHCCSNSTTATLMCPSMAPGPVPGGLITLGQHTYGHPILGGFIVGSRTSGDSTPDIKTDFPYSEGNRTVPCKVFKRMSVDRLPAGAGPICNRSHPA